MATAEQLLTAEAFGQLPNPGYPTELVRGEIVRMSPPNARHGQICARISRIVGVYADDHDLGHILTNDSGVITQRDPDSVRGADIAFYSFDRVARGPLPAGYLDVPPDLVFEVRSPGDRRAQLVAKAAEYLDAGVRLVVVVDPEQRVLFLHQPSGEVARLSESDTFEAPEILGEFACPVSRFLE